MGNCDEQNFTTAAEGDAVAGPGRPKSCEMGNVKVGAKERVVAEGPGGEVQESSRNGEEFLCWHVLHSESMQVA